MFKHNSKSLWADKVSSYRLDPLSIARALGGEVTGRNRILAPGPRHSRHDRSMSVMLDPSDPDGFKVNSFAGDDWAECKDYVRSRLELPARALSSGRRDARPRPDRTRTTRTSAGQPGYGSGLAGYGMRPAIHAAPSSSST
jgi:hypothetical protein